MTGQWSSFVDILRRTNGRLCGLWRREGSPSFLRPHFVRMAQMPVPPRHRAPPARPSPRAPRSTGGASAATSSSAARQSPRTLSEANSMWDEPQSAREQALSLKLVKTQQSSSSSAGRALASIQWRARAQSIREAQRQGLDPGVALSSDGRAACRAGLDVRGLGVGQVCGES